MRAKDDAVSAPPVSGRSPACGRRLMRGILRNAPITQQSIINNHQFPLDYPACISVSFGTVMGILL